MANNRPMTEDEKKLLQAQHRMEAIEARNRQKERKARTRRLIQMGAVLESVFPEVQTMELDDVKIPHLFLYLSIISLNFGCSRRYAHCGSVSNPLRRTGINSWDCIALVSGAIL